MTPRALKQKNEDVLCQLGIEVNARLPEIEPLAQLVPRHEVEVVSRAFVITNLIGLGYGRSTTEVRAWIQEAGLLQELTPLEQTLLNASEVTNSARAEVTWQAAAVHSIAWALQLEQMDLLRQCPDSLPSLFPPRTCPAPAIEVARLRSPVQIHELADLHYRLHWAARQARLCGRTFPVHECEVALRRKALDWMLGLSPWDTVSLDT